MWAVARFGLGHLSGTDDMMNGLAEQETYQGSNRTANHRNQFAKVLKECIRSCEVNVLGTILIVGGSPGDDAMCSVLVFVV